MNTVSCECDKPAWPTPRPRLTCAHSPPLSRSPDYCSGFKRFNHITHVPQGDGTGFQWLAVIPLGGVFLMLTLPLLVLVVIGRLPKLAAILGVIGLAAFGYVWMQLLSEFPKQ